MNQADFKTIMDNLNAAGEVMRGEDVPVFATGYDALIAYRNTKHACCLCQFWSVKEEGGVCEDCCDLEVE